MDVPVRVQNEPGEVERLHNVTGGLNNGRNAENVACCFRGKLERW